MTWHPLSYQGPIPKRVFLVATYPMRIKAPSQKECSLWLHIPCVSRPHPKKSVVSGHKHILCHAKRIVTGLESIP